MASPLLPPRLPSERRFGFLFAAIFFGLGIYGFHQGSTQLVCVAWLTASFVIGLVAFIAPGILAPYNHAWFLLGHYLGKIVSPIVLGLIFFGILTPIALIARRFGRDELRLKPRAIDSYWVERIPPGPSSDTFKNQF